MLILLFTTVELKTEFYFLIVMCCISSNMDILQSLFKFKIFIIKIPKKFPSILLVLNAVQDDIFGKTAPI